MKSCSHGRKVINTESVKEPDQVPRPYVSVIIPVFDDEEGVSACLGGLVTQTYPLDKFETIIVDNGSSIPIRVPKNFPFDIKVVRCMKPGAYAARNAGIAVACGSIFAFTDADCIPDENWLSAGVAALQREGRRKIIGGEVTMTLSQSPTATERYQYLTGFMQRENIERRGFTATANMFCSRDMMDRVGEFNKVLLSGGDREWAWRARKEGIDLAYAQNAIVYTSPRTTLKGAIRQARRVAAGRKNLRELNLTYMGVGLLKPHRSNLESLRWILTRHELNLGQRFKVLGVALAIRTATLMESMRLKLGGVAERR
ncbi:MAG: glycosyltransferase [Methylothermaceae bacterium]|nr:glycosyltransferase [Methylothermaceae bacterium]